MCLAVSAGVGICRSQASVKSTENLVDIFLVHLDISWWLFLCRLHVWSGVGAAGWEGVSSAALDICLLLSASSSLSRCCGNSEHLQAWSSCCLSLPSCFIILIFQCFTVLHAMGLKGSFVHNFLEWHLSRRRCLRLLLVMLCLLLHLCLIKIPQASFLSEMKQAVMQCPSHRVTKDSVATFH